MAATHPAATVIKSLPLTFYSREFYARMVRQWAGIGAGFILFVTALAFIVSAAVLHAPARQIAAQIHNMLTQMPDATMKDHKLTIDASVPFSIKVFDTAETGDTPRNLVIDTGFSSTDTTVITDYMKKTDAVFLVTADKFISRTDRGGVKIDELASIPDGHFTHDNWLSLARETDIWIYPILLVFTALWLLVGNAILALCGGVGVLVLGLIPGLKLDFTAALRLAAAAAVPACVITAPLQLSFAIKALIWLGYVIFGLLAVKKAAVSET